MKDAPLAVSIYLSVGLAIGLTAVWAVRKLIEMGKADPEVEATLRMLGAPVIVVALTLFWPAVIAYVIRDRMRGQR